MGRKNNLIEGLSGTGKTSVADELQRRGHHAIHGDRELAYRGRLHQCQIRLGLPVGSLSTSTNGRRHSGTSNGSAK